jgi:predicted GH43/DUF377 family glycosyl hydrolase
MQRSAHNPILTRSDIPDLPPHVVDVSSVFNPGAIKLGSRYLLLLRVQTRGRETILRLAESNDGDTFRVQPRQLAIEGLADLDVRIHHVYDPRLTSIDDIVYIVFAADVDDGCRLGVAKTCDFERLELVSFDRNNDTRNGVLFPETHHGKFIRLERPNRKRLASGVMTGDEIVLAESEDLIDWRTVGRVMAGRPRRWDEWIGSGPPPAKTRQGWLHLYHGVATHFASANIYQAGVVLLALDDPSRVLGRSRNNVLEPREPYELVGQVPNVVFPSGMIVETCDAEGFAATDSLVRIYYGGADTVVGLATTTIARLIASCTTS